MGLKLIPGGRGKQFQFACPFCGGLFETREDLDQHFESSPACYRNRMANNPTTDKYASYKDWGIEVSGPRLVTPPQGDERSGE